MHKTFTETEIDTLNQKFSTLSPQEIISFCLNRFHGHIALSSSLGLEDQVLTDMICKIDKSTRIFTLDTGRLFPETYLLIDKTNMKYGIKIEVLFPDREEVEKLVTEYGINCFYDSVENRKRCCKIRKINSLMRAFKNLDCWICGLRHEQSVTRKNVQIIEYDELNGLIKLNPIVNWSEEEVKKYIKSNQVPYNILHDRGFPSIGCQPCTRAVKEGEDIRAGRWWWENPEHKECGLHQR